MILPENYDYRPLPIGLFIGKTEINKESISFLKKNIRGIYIILNTKNNKFYLGSSICIKSRLKSHIKEINGNRHHSKHLYNSVIKYGWNNFKFYIIEEIDKDKNLFDTEQIYLDKYKPYNNNVGYNILRCAMGGAAESLKKSVLCFNMTGDLIKEYTCANNAALDLNISYDLVRSCLRKQQKKTNNFLFFYKNDIETIDKFKANPYEYLEHNSQGICKNNKFKPIGKKWSDETILKNKDSRKYEYRIEVYDFKTRAFIGFYKSINKCRDAINISKFLLSKFKDLQLFTIGSYIIRMNKLKKGVLPHNYHYRPLGPGLIIKTDVNSSMGLFTQLIILKDTTLGRTHIKIDNNLYRLETGAFINHSKNPNCIITTIDETSNIYILKTLRMIKQGEELTVDYFKSDCAKDTVCKKQ